MAVFRHNRPQFTHFHQELRLISGLFHFPAMAFGLHISVSLCLQLSFGIGKGECAMGKRFSDIHPELVCEWSNRNAPLQPSDITYGSNKLYWWIGRCGHEWQASPKSRHAGEGCPYCAGMRVLEGFNNLASVKPELVAEWSPDNTPLKPNGVNAWSHRKLHTTCFWTQVMRSLFSVSLVKQWAVYY